MSTNHNRIRVADLETNDPNKILKTNQNGELEFSDANNLHAEGYNALDYTTEGKALDARQGKVLKEMIDNKTVNLASDTETQINTTVSEDSKVVSRSKLFNWWEWVKTQSQTISGMWNFNSKVTFAPSTTTMPSLIIPNGTMSLRPENGALERDQEGNLFHAISNFYRYKLLDTRDYGKFLITTWRSRGLGMASYYGAKTGNTSGFKSISVEALGSYNEGHFLFKTFDYYTINGTYYNPDYKAPKTIIFEVFMNGINCTFSGNQSVKIYDVTYDTKSTGSVRNYETPILVTSFMNGSVIRLPQRSYNNVGNIISENFTEYNLKSLGSTDYYPDMKITNAQFSLEYKVSVLFEDNLNQNYQNSTASISFYNYSSQFIDLNNFL
ncbi:hypothetical protein [Flavobacterium sp. 2]|uniref:hypothetical protein n=1 Tax=Flavobacterium sp. 2 TaxID=308053 RepID=UPI000C1A8409|nr:hypothetical protein [Flavobacterium sp. 2]PIF60073.1 hypothetical protein CLU99_3318 [Flavobacterium sp. 2]